VKLIVINIIINKLITNKIFNNKLVKRGLNLKKNLSIIIISTIII